MATYDFSKLKTSWTKYDIVRVMDVITNTDRIDAYKTKEIVIDEPILKSFLGINSLQDLTPPCWLQIQNFPIEKKLFALLAVLFTHNKVVKMFADKYSNSNMGGLFIMENDKMYTNIRSALVEGGATLSNYRREDDVPYDFSLIYKNGEVGKLFKELLKERVTRISQVNIADEDFYSICLNNRFDKALGLSTEQFRLWLEGSPIIQVQESNHIKNVEISNFYSIEEVKLEFNDSKEIYFLGENGDGKSLILIAIYLAFKANFLTNLNDIEKIAKAITMLKENHEFLPLGKDNSDKEYGIGKDIFLNNIYAYGTHRGRYSTDQAEEYGFMSLFDADQTLINPITWLSRQKAIELEKAGGDEENLSTKPSNLLSLSVESLQTMFCDLLEKNVTIKVEVEGVEFIEKGSKSLSFNQLSEGYKSIIIFVCDLLFRLGQSSKAGQSLADLKGVVLVDEIDLHLHLKWQRTIVHKLRGIFPGIQFIFTTHSPTIIQGAGDDAVIFRVYRTTEDGKTKVSDPYLRKNLDHLMINSLVTSPLFGLEDSRLNTTDDEANTSETYLLYKINEKLKTELNAQRLSGKVFINESEIDKLIEEIFDKELNKNDQNK